ncbi:hypothetical protein Ddep01_03020 [Deinococcus depolymerans]
MGCPDQFASHCRELNTFGEPSDLVAHEFRQGNVELPFIQRFSSIAFISPRLGINRVNHGQATPALINMEPRKIFLETIAWKGLVDGGPNILPRVIGKGHLNRGCAWGLRRLCRHRLRCARGLGLTVTVGFRRAGYDAAGEQHACAEQNSHGRMLAVGPYTSPSNRLCGQIWRAAPPPAQDAALTLMGSAQCDHRRVFIPVRRSPRRAATRPGTCIGQVQTTVSGVTHPPGGDSWGSGACGPPVTRFALWSVARSLRQCSPMWWVHAAVYRAATLHLAGDRHVWPVRFAVMNTWVRSQFGGQLGASRLGAGASRGQVRVPRVQRDAKVSGT